ncbi:hypothetical protein N6H05_14910 [Sphingobium sp. WTD-1]|uniref:hypothetical protein n=1 Tax=Sphingobium sp. WTD-1 TaxID=2979467 RepID=UPI0024DE483A|nr:hypothetical protein [Sphingobium sp. WTD-1]WIA54355.1 hypothetical protein N6H05_14910 [Sphingobium sp. WTD-1]
MRDRLETLKAAIKAHGEAVVSIIPNHNPCGVVHADADQWDMLVSAGDAEKRARADLMPTEQDAIDLMHQAHLRLRELGWREAIYCPKDGTEFDAIEAGSTGIQRAHYLGTWPTGGWMVASDGDLWPSHPCLYRPTAAELAAKEERAKRFQQLANDNRPRTIFSDDVDPAAREEAGHDALR